MKEITRKDYFKLKNVYLNIKLIKTVSGFLFGFFVLCSLLFASLITIYEQNSTDSVIIEKRDEISTFLRYGFVFTLSLFLVTIVICFLLKRKLLPMKFKLEIIDEI